MAIVTHTLNVDAFGNNVEGGIIGDFTRQLLGVETAASSDVTVNISFRGDFEVPLGGTGDEFGLNIEGTLAAGFTGGEYQDSTASFTISQAVWQSIIADGTIDVLFDMGSGVQDFSFLYGFEEYINLTFTWDDGVANVIKGTSGKDNLLGTAGADILRGLGGNDVLKGFGGDDILRSMGGNDKLWGGIGADTFVFSSWGGRDTIMDFETGVDTINIRKWAAIEDYADLRSHATNKNGDLWIVDGRDALIIKDFTKGELDVNDFLF